MTLSCVTCKIPGRPTELLKFAVSVQKDLIPSGSCFEGSRLISLNILTKHTPEKHPGYFTLQSNLKHSSALHFWFVSSVYATWKTPKPESRRQIKHLWFQCISYWPSQDCIMQGGRVNCKGFRTGQKLPHALARKQPNNLWGRLERVLHIRFPR